LGLPVRLDVDDYRLRDRMAVVKAFRENQVYLSNEVYWMGLMLSKRKVSGTDATMTIDQLVDSELRDKWTRESPELVLLWDKHQAARQVAKKAYDLIEQEALRNAKDKEPMIE
jgi:hypothetical protein